VPRVRLFGSSDTQGGQGPTATLTVDLLVEFDRRSSMFDLMQMAHELDALFGRAVDIVSTGKPENRARVILAQSVDL